MERHLCLMDMIARFLNEPRTNPFLVGCRSTSFALSRASLVLSATMQRVKVTKLSPRDYSDLHMGWIIKSNPRRHESHAFCATEPLAYRFCLPTFRTLARYSLVRAHSLAVIDAVSGHHLYSSRWPMHT